MGFFSSSFDDGHKGSTQADICCLSVSEWEAIWKMSVDGKMCVDRQAFPVAAGLKP